MRLLLPEHRPLAVADLLDLYDPGDAPSLRAGFVLSTDGAVVLDGGSRALQTAADQAVFHVLRAVADAVLVGAGTMRQEGYGPVRPRADGRSWRAARGLPPAPPLVVVSRSLDLDPGDRAFQGDSRAVVITCDAAPDAAVRSLSEVADVVVAGAEEVDLALALTRLSERGLTRLLCEGGPRLLTDLLAAELVDELCLTLTPLLVGGAPGLLAGPLPAPRRLELRHLVDGGDALLARYAVV